MSVEFTPQILKIPVVLCQKMKVPKNLVDDMIAEGHLLIVEAATKFDPTRGVLFSSYVYKQVEFRIARALGRGQTNRSTCAGRWNRLEICDPQCKLAGVIDTDQKDAETVEDLNRAMRRLTKLEKVVYQLIHVEERSIRWISERRGIAREEVSAVLTSAENKMDRWRRRGHTGQATSKDDLIVANAARAAWSEERRNSYWEVRRKALVGYRKQRRITNRVAGMVPLGGFYIVDDANKIIWGEFTTIRNIAQLIGKIKELPKSGRWAIPFISRCISPLRAVTGKIARQVLADGYRLKEASSLDIPLIGNRNIV